MGEFGADKLPEQLRVALEGYRKDGNAESWTALSQLWVGDIQVVDALKRVKPDFPDPFPLPVDGIIEDSGNFLQWPMLPEPDDVLRGLLAALRL
jgi:hypothetical protein